MMKDLIDIVRGASVIALICGIIIVFERWHEGSFMLLITLAMFIIVAKVLGIQLRDWLGEDK